MRAQFSKIVEICNVFIVMSLGFLAQAVGRTRMYFYTGLVYFAGRSIQSLRVANFWEKIRKQK
jgi:hypothetical protein